MVDVLASSHVFQSKRVFRDLIIVEISIRFGNRWQTTCMRNVKRLLCALRVSFKSLILKNMNSETVKGD